MMDIVKVRTILNRIRYKNWSFYLGQLADGHLYIQAQFPAACADSGVIETQFGRKWLLSEHMTLSEIIQTAFKAVMTAEEHETRECFRFDGQPIFGPHFYVSDLFEVAAYRERDARAPRVAGE
jgi:hypothetical protein